MSTEAPANPTLKRARRKSTRLEQVSRVASLLFEGDGGSFDRLYRALNASEQELFWLEMSQLRQSQSLTEKQSIHMDFLRPPPRMEQFIEDDYYLGRTLRPSEDNIGIYPLWREILTRDFNLGSLIHNVVITGSLGVGKCTGPGTRIVMFDGTVKKVEDIVAGDLIMGDDSTPRTVLATAQGLGKMYEIVPVKGEAFTVNGDHILVLKATDSDEITEVAVNDFLKWPREKRHKACLYRVSVDWAERELPIDPYALGLWLGGGHAEQTVLTTAEGTQKFVQKGIPKGYLTNSRKNRLELLAGLLDGSKAGRGEGVYEITSKLKELADHTRFLAQSLGYYARTSVKEVSSTAYYRTHISGAHSVPCRLAHKKSKPRPPRLSPHTGEEVNFDVSKSRFAVVPLEEGPYYGFTLSGNGRFLLGDFTVTHNTWILVAIMLYRLVLTTLLRNPQNFFGISRGSNIIYNILSVTREVVRQTAFGDALNFMQMSPYFLEELRFNPEMEYSKSIIPFRNNIYLTAGSKGWHVLGRNVLGVGLDEGNFRLEQDPDRKAYALYDQIRTRIANRFQRSEGFLPAISIIASSASDESSFTETIIREIQKVNSPKTQQVYRQPVYRVKRHELKLGKRWFRVAYGLRNQEPCILRGWFLEDGTPLEPEATLEEPPRGAQIEMVPEMYYSDFRRNCRVNLQSISGISTGGTHRLFSSLIDVEACLELSEKEGIVNPVRNNLRSFSISVEDELNIWDYLVHSVFATKVQSRVIPKRHPNRLRYAHLDLATTGKAGLSICHLVGGKRVEGVVRDGLPFDEYRLMVEYDFILTLTAGQTKPINFDKICRFFFWLRDMCGFRFGLITADMFQSEMPLQTLEAAGFKVDKQSLDRDKAAYIAWRTGFEDHRIRLYRSEEMLEEAEKLMEGPKKFDHPDNGCFTGDTRVALLDGTVPTFTELAERYPNGAKFPVFSMKPDGVCVGWGHSPRVTKRARIVEVLLDNYQVIRCTADHRFMLLDGSWVEAQFLSPNMSLMPLYRARERKGGWLGYERVWCPVKCIRLLVHQMVARQFLGDSHGRIVHHVNEVRHDNSPGNLEYKTREQHAADHARSRHQTDQAYVYRLREGHRLYRLNGGNQKSRENILKLYAEGTLKRGRGKCSVDGCADMSSVKGKCGKHYQLDRRKALRARGSLNHSILSVTPTNQEEAVWDITVDSSHNFALASGVFVHNSKDTLDSAAGAYFSAINSEERTTLLTEAVPSVHGYAGLESQDHPDPMAALEFPLPSRTYRTVKETVLR